MVVPYTGRPVRTQSFNVNCTVVGTSYTLYTCPANCRAEVTMLMITNSGGTVTLTTNWVDVSTGHSVAIVGGKNMGTGDYILFTGATLVLEAGDTLVISTAGTGTCHVDGLCTATEIFKPIG